MSDDEDGLFEKDREEDRETTHLFRGLMLTTAVLVLLMIGFGIAFLVTQVDIRCDPNNDLCRYGGVCNATTLHCDCDLYPQYPLCDPLQANLWTYNGVYGLIVVILFILLVSAWCSFGYNFEKHFNTHNLVLRQRKELDAIHEEIEKIKKRN